MLIYFWKVPALIRSPLVVIALLAMAYPAIASPSDVINAKAEKRGGTWTISATIRHADTGWDHYADRFVVVAPDGTVLATRELAHPHVNEQPFTRSVSGVTIPDSADYVTIRADDNLDDESGAAFRIDLK